MSKCGILRVHFDTFSSKKEHGQMLWSSCATASSEDFATCSFTGKELDTETGYGYFGARYMDFDLLTMWLSVDPMADKYPSISPYAYCVWNPIKLVDLKGEESIESDDKWQYNTSTGRLTWINDDGGISHQTVEMMHNQKGTTVIDQTVSFGGNITRMFDCSVVTPTVDGIIGGGLDIATGVSEAGAGVALGVGISAVSGGVATPLGMTTGGTLIAVGGAQIAFGFRDMMSSIEGCSNTSVKHNFIKDACKAGLGFGTSLLRSGQKGIGGSLRSFSLSAGWSYLTWRAAAYPNNKGIPKGATIKQ